MPVVGKSAQEIARRAAYFVEMIELALTSAAYTGKELVWHPEVGNVLAHVYFAMSEAYKRKHLSVGSRTDVTKIAALTSATIAIVKPLRPTNQDLGLEGYYLNEIFGLRCACSIVEHPHRNFDDMRRFARVFHGAEWPSVAPIIAEAVEKNGQIITEFEIDLTREEFVKLNGLVNLYVVLRDLKVYQQAVTQAQPQGD